MGGGILDFYQTVPLGHITFSVYGNLCIQHNLCHHPLEALDVFRQQYFENGALSEDQKRELNQVLESFAPYQHFLAGELAVMLMQSTADVVSPEELQSLPLVEILRRSIESIIETIEVLESIHQS